MIRMRRRSKGVASSTKPWCMAARASAAAQHMRWQPKQQNHDSRGRGAVSTEKRHYRGGDARGLCDALRPKAKVFRNGGVSRPRTPHQSSLALGLGALVHVPGPLRRRSAFFAGLVTFFFFFSIDIWEKQPNYLAHGPLQEHSFTQPPCVDWRRGHEQEHPCSLAETDAAV
jgi:hypothetical protein